ncbi:hypothetical protein H6F50_09900 [Coleofasciculus sp. FACHB-712]|uniref:hypothetical protein n=1 Tax=Coleofasciculus sp. FACHB-712 TaxID=2692789 RepID=UPI0016873088|nr:hypothetical protein [Coleofasciculus sp. FACHB-712]MBD1942665.1 hypothetical protein [Coleofasciculus sp. FACHB-712]
MEGKLRSRLNRRRFLLGCTLTGGGIVAADLLSKSGQAQVAAPAIVTSDKMRPQIPFGVASGDITGNSAVVWSRCNRPGRMIVKYSIYRVIPECAAGCGTRCPGKQRFHSTDLPG